MAARAEAAEGGGGRIGTLAARKGSALAIFVRVAGQATVAIIVTGVGGRLGRGARKVAAHVKTVSASPPPIHTPCPSICGPLPQPHGG